MSKPLLTQPMIIAIVATAIVVGPLSFFGGMKYDASKAGAKVAAGGANGASNFAQRQGGVRAAGGQFAGAPGAPGAAGATGTTARRNIGGSTVGEILSIDDLGITVKLAAGGSRRILMPEKVTVSSCSEVDKSSVAVGKFVIVSGDVNADNSVTARNIQIMPMMPTNMPVGARPQDGTGAGSGAGAGAEVGGRMMQPPTQAQ